MNHAFIHAVLIFVFPVVILIIGGSVLLKATGRDHTLKLLRDRARPEDRRPLYARVSGYDVGAVDRHWRAFDDRALHNEEVFLKADLLFAVVYGSAFLTSLAFARAFLSSPMSASWIFGNICVVFTIVSDWTENLAQLGQLRRYLEMKAEGLQAVNIGVASIATQAKWMFLLLSFASVAIAAVECARQGIT